MFKNLVNCDRYTLEYHAFVYLNSGCDPVIDTPLV